MQQARWIGYPRAKEVLEKLEGLLNHPHKARMPNMLLVGETNNGKTVIVNRFLEGHPPDDNPSGEAIHVPVLSIEAPPTPDEARFYDEILYKLNIPFRKSDRVSNKALQVEKVFRYVGLRMLIVDEIHNLLAGHEKRQRQFLNALKWLTNTLQIPIVGVGTPEATAALRVDPQVRNRFTPMELPKWENDKAFRRLLASFERTLPLKWPSNLHERELARRLHALSEGTIGELADLLGMAAIEAIRGGEECINSQLVGALGWTPPSKR
ncbi:TniB family NTP-binding protein [Thiohalorhabdus methylotrophus]|uniref:TniB family NTP-binding protein n=1 Tax=Thiohalorhabdus methylotrophus TaxID=3242694 RepID=A0ABV4TTG9_9GAMM